MKYFNLLLIAFTGIAFTSCEQTTGSDKYDAVWTPSGEAKNTPWEFPAGVEFSQSDNGFRFTATITDSVPVSYAFSPKIFSVSNITSAQSAMVAFTAKITSDPDSISLTPSGTVVHQFGSVGGSITTRGADSLSFSTKAITSNGNSNITLSVNPDSCSKMLRFNVVLSWNNFAGGTSLNALPKSKKVSVEFTNIVMRINGITVLK